MLYQKSRHLVESNGQFTVGDPQIDSKTKNMQWDNIMDVLGPQRGSLKRLRSQLASDGCPESQVVLARQLLDEECGMFEASHGCKK